MPPPTEEERQSIIDALKERYTNPNQYKRGMPDSGPFMSDHLNYLSKMYQKLAPAVQQVDPFANFPRESASLQPKPFNPRSLTPDLYEE